MNVNLDETASHLDGSNANISDQSTVVLTNGGFPLHGFVLSITSQSNTLKMESNSFVKVMPPHLQFFTTEKLMQGKRYIL